MSMDKDRLGGAIWTAVKAQETYSPGLTPGQDARGLQLWTAIAEQIILEITGHAVVTTVGADPQGGSVNSTGTVT